jgi:hypothetical protein
MVIVNLKGGLGNQMFQYALGYSLAKNNNVPLVCDLRYLRERYGQNNYTNRVFSLGIFGIEPGKVTKADLFKVGMLFGDYRARYLVGKVFDRLGILTLSETFPAFESRALSRNAKHLYLDGYWQSEKYFKAHELEIKKLFQLNENSFDENVTELAKKIECNENAICINVRRSDFVGSKIHDVTTKDYYIKSLLSIKGRISGEPHVFIFSDDIEWCRCNLLDISQKVTLVGHEFAGKFFSAYFHLMTKFRFFVIPNSSYAWWAAWLAPNLNKIVIAPRVWSGIKNLEPLDIIPDSWERQ